jgi:cytochrome P450
VTTLPVELIAPLFNPASFAQAGLIDGILQEVRARYPLARAEVPGFDAHWIVSRHADVLEVSKKNDLFHNADRSATLITRDGQKLVEQFTGGAANLFRSLVQLDPPEHGPYRQVTTKAFSPQNIAHLRDHIATVVAERVAGLRELGEEFDFAHELAMPYPLGVVLDLVGVPRADHPQMLRLTQWLFSWADPDLRRPGTDPLDPTHQTRTWKIVFDEFNDYYSLLMADRRANPRDDLATLIANAEVDGMPMEHNAAISYYAILSTAGHDTTSHTTATAMSLLAGNPGLLAQLKENPGLIAAFVEEAIRWTSPVKQFIRHATADCTLAGQQITQGDRLYLSYPSANRDETVFGSPFEFRLDRQPNRHVGFGHGGHVCLGQHLARLEMKLLWEALIPEIHSVELAGEVQLIHSEFVSGPKSVPIRLRYRH